LNAVKVRVATVTSGRACHEHPMPTLKRLKWWPSVTPFCLYTHEEMYWYRTTKWGHHLSPPRWGSSTG
jgi:hypothetical protein